ncbi:unnamed protein product, partial [Musa banksii]
RRNPALIAETALFLRRRLRRLLSERRLPSSPSGNSDSRRWRLPLPFFAELGRVPLTILS